MAIEILAIIGGRRFHGPKLIQLISVDIESHRIGKNAKFIRKTLASHENNARNPRPDRPWSRWIVRNTQHAHLYYRPVERSLDRRTDLAFEVGTGRVRSRRLRPKFKYAASLRNAVNRRPSRYYSTGFITIPRARVGDKRRKQIIFRSSHNSPCSSTRCLFPTCLSPVNNEVRSKKHSIRSRARAR